MRKLFIRYVTGSHIIWLCSTSSNTLVICNYSPQSGGTAGTLNFWSLVRPCTKNSFSRLGHSYKWLLGIIYFAFMHPPPPRGMSKSLILCLQFPIVVTTLWGQLAGKPVTFSHPAACYYTALPWLPMSFM